MASGLNINKLITETIEERCKDPFVNELIKRSLQYEIDMWNRHPRKSETEAQYQLMVEKIVREMPE